MKTTLLRPFLALCVLLSICITSRSQSTIIWTGANLNSDWNDIGNWNTGTLPTSFDKIIISNVADSMPLLLDSAQIANLIIQPTAQLTIDTHAVLIINSSIGDALSIHGTFNNHGHVQIVTAHRGIGPTAGIGEINNYGSIEIQAYSSEAIRYHDLYNSYLAKIDVSSASSDGIVITNSLINYGYITVDSAANIGLYTIGNEIKNYCPGNISINQSEIGIHCLGDFVNFSTIKINDVSKGIIQEALNALGMFSNKDERLIFIENVRDTALRAKRFENTGYVEIQGNPGAVGIHVPDSSIFNSPDIGQVNLYGSFDAPLIVDAGGAFFSTQYSERFFDQEKLDWQYHRNEYHRKIDDEPRNFLIHVPEIYDSTTAVPLLFMLHGGSGDGTKFYNISQWKETADIENFISVYPSALRYVIAEHMECSTRWNDDRLQIKTLPGATIKDDVLFMRKLISLCKNTFNIDTSRIYFCGFSNGSGFVRERVLTEMTDIVTATAGAGSFGHVEVEYPVDSIYLPHWGLFGTHDPKLLQGPGLMKFPMNGDSLLVIPEVLERVQNITTSLQIDMNFNQNPSPPLYNTLEFFTDLSGQGNEYKLSIVKDLEHQFANGTNHPLVYADILWPWFMQWQR